MGGARFVGVQRSSYWALFRVILVRWVQVCLCRTWTSRRVRVSLTSWSPFETSRRTLSSEYERITHSLSLSHTHKHTHTYTHTHTHTRTHTHHSHVSFHECVITHVLSCHTYTHCILHTHQPPNPPHPDTHTHTHTHTITTCIHTLTHIIYKYIRTYICTQAHTHTETHTYSDYYVETCTTISTTGQAVNLPVNDSVPSYQEPPPRSSEYTHTHARTHAHTHTTHLYHVKCIRRPHFLAVSVVVLLHMVHVSERSV